MQTNKTEYTPSSTSSSSVSFLTPAIRVQKEDDDEEEESSSLSAAAAAAASSIIPSTRIRPMEKDKQEEGGDATATIGTNIGGNRRAGALRGVKKEEDDLEDDQQNSIPTMTTTTLPASSSLMVPDPMRSSSSSNISSSCWRPYTNDTNLITDGRSATISAAAAVAVGVGVAVGVTPAVAARTTTTVKATITIKKRKSEQSRNNKNKQSSSIIQNKKKKNNNNSSSSSSSSNNNNNTNNTASVEDIDHRDGLSDDGNDDDNDSDDNDEDDNTDEDDLENENDDDSDDSNGVATDTTTTTTTTTTNGEKVVPNKQEEKWNEMYNRHIAYNNKYQSNIVPVRCADDPRLGKWVSKQRRFYNKNKLAKDRINRLNSIGFVWNIHDAQWTEKYDRLVKYKKEYKTTCVPSTYSADPQLGQWVRHQRLFYNTNHPRLTADRITQLNLIGFVWNMR